MTINTRVLLLAMLAVISCPAESMQPKGRYQWGEISDRNGLPCIGVSDVRESRKYGVEVSGVDLYQRQAGKQVAVWTQYYAGAGAQSPVVAPGDCVAHEVLAENPFPVFEIGERYTTTVVAVIEKGAGKRERRYYHGYFCMVEKEGLRHVHQVLFDKRREVWAWDACTPVSGDRAPASNR